MDQPDCEVGCEVSASVFFPVMIEGQARSRASLPGLISARAEALVFFHSNFAAKLNDFFDRTTVTRHGLAVHRTQPAPFLTERNQTNPSSGHPATSIRRLETNPPARSVAVSQARDV